ncbi:uncharacterized protein LOC128677166 [Plodia interpunctella]|uniref:uncharacterized protein LOC128677166 n=1 Tax=Plodia interpunctella TaxID=58824 RepID=UPI002368B2E6|nr:uncharacterized protein LOC128677166 [Plodia interpunctella]
MQDESTDITFRTWNRNVDSINKIGYMDGSSDGQKASFQPSFDSGYAQGLNIGIKLGFLRAMSSVRNEHNTDNIHLGDQRQINCHICIDGSIIQQNVGNLYNLQKEKNDEMEKNINKILKT